MWKVIKYTNIAVYLLHAMLFILPMVMLQLLTHLISYSKIKYLRINNNVKRGIYDYM
jgi:hypothetical protein